MRNLEMSKNLVADLERVSKSKVGTIHEEVAYMILKRIPEIQKCIDGVEQNKADSLIRLIVILGEIEKCTKPGSTWNSHIRVIEQDLTIFFEDNYGLDLSMIERRG